MTLLTTFQNHAATIGLSAVVTVAGITYGVTDKLIVAPKVERIIVLQQENKKIADELIRLESIKSTAEKSEQVITTALAKAQIDTEQQTQKNANFKATNDSLESNLVRWQNGYNNLSAQVSKMNETCNVITHIATVSAQKDQMEQNIAYQLANRDIRKVEEYKRQADELQARLLKLETGLTCTSK